MSGPFPCNNKPSTCETNPNPLTKFSSEADDSTTFIGLAWQNQLPALNKPFDVYPCEAIVESQGSQADADIKSSNEVVICANPCAPIFSNSAQTASGTCSNGSIYSVTVPAGTFVADNQVMADRKAFSAAAATLRGRSICMGALVPAATLCRGDFYFGIISISSTDAPVSIVLVSGDLPGGLSLVFESDRVVLQGTAVAFGSTRFILRATSAAGLVTQQEYSVSVTGIVTDSSLPDAFFGTPYSVSLTAFNPDNAVALWTVSSGTLPSGLSLNSSTGVISGTPTGGGGLDTFTVEYSLNGSTCSKDFKINAQFINWGAMVWSNILVVPGGGVGGSASGVFSGSQFSVSGKGNGSPSAKVEALGTMSYTGPAVNCKIVIVVTAQGVQPSGLSVFQDGVQVLILNQTNLTLGTHTFNFSLIAGVTSVINIKGLTDILDPARLFIFGSDSNLWAWSAVLSQA